MCVCVCAYICVCLCLCMYECMYVCMSSESSSGLRAQIFLTTLDQYLTEKIIGLHGGVAAQHVTSYCSSLSVIGANWTPT